MVGYFYLLVEAGTAARESRKAVAWRKLQTGGDGDGDGGLRMH